MLTKLEKLEIWRDLLTVTSILLIVVAFIMTISLFFIRKEIMEIHYKQWIELNDKNQ